MTHFQGLIGQERLKDNVSLFIDSALRTGFFPPTLFVAPKGFGKTRFCHETARALKKPMLEVNGSTVKNLDSFVDQVLYEIVGRDITIFIDEMHGLPLKVAEVLLSFLSVNSSYSNSVLIDGMSFNIDLKKQSFMFATTERQKVFAPLLDRFEQVTFEDYTIDELSRILKMSIKDITIDDDALSFLGSYSRGNSRDAVKMGIKVNIFAGAYGINHMGMKEAKELIRRLNIYGLGLNSEEFKTLKILYDNKDGLSLGVLAAKTGMTRPAQQDIEKYPQKHNLMVIDGKRFLTFKGRKYVEKELNIT